MDSPRIELGHLDLQSSALPFELRVHIMRFIKPNIGFLYHGLPNRTIFPILSIWRTCKCSRSRTYPLEGLRFYRSWWRTDSQPYTHIFCAPWELRYPDLKVNNLLLCLWAKGAYLKFMSLWKDLNLRLPSHQDGTLTGLSYIELLWTTWESNPNIFIASEVTCLWYSAHI